MSPISDAVCDKAWSGIVEMVDDGILTMRQAYAIACTARVLVRQRKIREDAHLLQFVGFVHLFMTEGDPVPVVYPTGRVVRYINRRAV